MEKLIEKYGDDAVHVYDTAVLTYCWSRSEASGLYAIDCEDLSNIFCEMMEKLDSRALLNLSKEQLEKREEETSEHGSSTINF